MEEVSDEMLSQWGDWIARLSQSDRSVQEAVLMQIPPQCRAQIVAIPLPPLKKEKGKDAAAEQDQQRAAGGLVDVEQPPARQCRLRQTEQGFLTSVCDDGLKLMVMFHAQNELIGVPFSGLFTGQERYFSVFLSALQSVPSLLLVTPLSLQG